METFAEIFGAWPSVRDLADDLGTTDVHVRTMRSRGAIPAAHWPALIVGATKRNIAGITPASLMFMLSEQRVQKRRKQGGQAVGEAQP